ncbi:head-tail connector protein [Stenotrophomonas sp.]|uniref:head-tail connector protein n=1 Tax=Stenotrophomonas sp. TaxID=69392 RepID=UPI0028ABADE5|nr:head-tail connector protein [Stenotrophomonas sp.]
MELITLGQARSHCRVDSDDDALLELYGSASEGAAQQFLNRRVFPDADTMAAAVLDGTAGIDPILVNDSIRAAVLLMLGHLYRTREDVQGGDGATVQVPMGAHSLLWPYRIGLGV